MPSQAIVAMLNQRGMRITQPRQQIIDQICAMADASSFTAEDICEQLPHIGRATIYRTIRMLQEVGFLCKVVLAGGERAYTVSDAVDMQHHHHVVCTICNSAREFTAGSIEQALSALNTTNGELGEIVGHRIELYDVCRQCQAYPFEV